MRIFTDTPSIRDMATLLFEGTISRKNMKQITEPELDLSVLNAVEKEIREELACGHLTAVDIRKALKEADTYMDAYIDWCEEFAKK